jgi:hypothetical protein
MKRIDTQQVLTVLRSLRLQIAEVHKASLVIYERQQCALVRMNDVVAEQTRETHG